METQKRVRAIVSLFEFELAQNCDIHMEEEGSGTAVELIFPTKLGSHGRLVSLENSASTAVPRTLIFYVCEYITRLWLSIFILRDVCQKYFL